jgi:hypothetical protein
MVTLSSVAGRFALFVMGHVVVLGLVVMFSMSVGQAVPDLGVADQTVTGSLAR